MISIEKTHDEILKDEVLKIIESSNNISKGTDIRHKNLWNLIWNNKNVTPQEIFDVFSTDAYKLFELSSALQTLLSRVIENYQFMTPKYEYTINEDGSVTVGSLIDAEVIDEVI